MTTTRRLREGILIAVAAITSAGHASAQGGAMDPWKMVQTAVEKACAPYFGPNGAFHKWLASYRTEVVEKLSVGDDSDILTRQMAAMDLPGGGYRSTVPMEHSLNYIQKMRVVWDVRPRKSTPTIELKK